MTEEPYKPQTKEAEATKEPALTRLQRRAMERNNALYKGRFEDLCSKFHDFFMDNDPESEVMKAKQKEYSAKWRVYCGNNQLKKEAIPLFDDFADNLIKKYLDAKG